MSPFGQQETWLIIAYVSLVAPSDQTTTAAPLGFSHSTFMPLCVHSFGHICSLSRFLEAAQHAAENMRGMETELCSSHSAKHAAQSSFRMPHQSAICVVKP